MDMVEELPFGTVSFVAYILLNTAVIVPCLAAAPTGHTVFVYILGLL